jgi:hypothetical protein
MNATSSLTALPKTPMGTSSLPSPVMSPARTGAGPTRTSTAVVTPSSRAKPTKKTSGYTNLLEIEMKKVMYELQKQANVVSEIEASRPATSSSNNNDDDSSYLAKKEDTFEEVEELYNRIVSYRKDAYDQLKHVEYICNL